MRTTRSPRPEVTVLTQLRLASQILKTGNTLKTLGNLPIPVVT
nr:MAG TPA: hypothetical protein [Caudoviricetes sp.]